MGSFLQKLKITRFIVSCLVLLTGLSAGQVNGQTLIAGWDFQTTANGGTAAAAAPSSPTVYVANFGTGSIFLNGANGSSSWITASGATNELTAFGGTAVNAGVGFATSTGSPSAIAVVGGGATFTANGKSMVFQFSMTGLQNLVVSYATQRSGTGFNLQSWEYSTNGSSWTAIGTVVPPASFAAQTLSTITALNNAATAYLRMTVTGATAAAGNNRLDNIQLNASTIPVAAITVGALTPAGNFTTTVGTASAVKTFTVTGSNLSLPLNIAAVSGYEYSDDGFATAGVASLSYNTASVSKTISVRLTGASIGTFNGSIAVTSTGATGSPANVTVNGTVNPLAATLTVGALTPGGAFSANTGSPSAAQTFTVDGTNLTASVNIDPVTGYEYSDDGFATAGVSSLSYNTATVSKVISVRLTGASPGTFNGTINIESTGATGSPASVAVAGTVSTPPPSITVGALTPNTAFSTTAGTPSAAKTFTVSGSFLSAPLDIAALAGYEYSDDAFATAGVSSLTYNTATVSKTISVRLTGASAGTFNGSIAISSAGATGSPASVAVTGDVAPLVPSLSVGALTPNNVFSTTTGTASAAQTFTITATNLSAPLEVAAVTGYEYSDDGFATAAVSSLSYNTASVTKTISVRLSGASAGIFSGAVSVSSTGAPGSPVSIAVSGIVTDPGDNGLLQWNTFSNAGTESTEPSVTNNTNIAAANLTLGSVTPAANGNRFGGSAWFNTGNTAGGNTLAEAVTGNDYIQFVVTPNAGIAFTPTSLAFYWDRSGSGPSNVTLRSSADGFTSNIGSVTGMVSGGAALTTLRLIPISGLSGLTTATTFRLYGYGATAAGGTGGFDIGTNTVNVTLNGSTAATSAITVGALTPGGSFTTTVGTPSAAQTFTVSGSNLTSTLDIAPVTGYEYSDDGFATAGVSSLSYNTATVNQTISVRLTGAAEGTFNGSIAVSSTNAAGSPASVAVTGTVNPLTPTISVGSLTPGTAFSTNTGTASAAQTFTVAATNLTAPLTVDPLAGYEYSDDAFATAGVSSLTYNTANVLKTISVRLTGVSEGTFNGNIVVTSTGATGSPASVAVSGTVTTPPPALTVGALTPAGAFNGNTGTPSVAKTFTVNGTFLTAPLTISAVTGYEYSDDGFATAGVSSFTYNTATVVKTISVRLTGAAEGSFNGTITVESVGATGSPATITLTGTVSAPGLLQWNTFGNTGNETTEASVYNDPHLTASNLTLGTITPAANANRFGGSAWFDAGNTNPSTIANAVAGDNYVQFIVTPNSGYSFTPSSLVFNWDKSGTGPQNVVLRSSADGFTTDLGIVAPTGTIAVSNTINITGLTALTTPVTFRLYGYGATAAGGTGGFDVSSNTVNVKLNGSTAATDLTITASAGTGGSVTPAGSTILPPGSNQTYTITPEGCNTIADVLVDGVSQGPVTSYTFTNVSANHTISASFNTNTFTQWTGAVSNNWNDNANWTACVPTAATYVYIPGNGNGDPVVSVQPVLSADAITGDLEMGTDATLTIGSNTLTINGLYADDGNASLVGSNTSNLVINGTNGVTFLTLSSAAALTLKNLTINGGTATLTTPVSITAGTTLNTAGTVTVATGAVLEANGFLTLKSNQFGTARVAQGSAAGNYITGDVTVERYIPNNGFRAWRLLSIPTSGTQTIHQAWQENNAPGVVGTPGLGTNITGPAGSTGMDAVSNTASILSWNAGSWSNVPSTNVAISSNLNKAYFLFVRGDRTKGIIGALTNTNATTLRTRGQLYTGDQASIAVPSSAFTLIPNLYTSAIDFLGLSKTGIQNLFYIWDSKLRIGSSLGAYQTFSSTNGFNPTIAGGSYVMGQPNTAIESGQGFLVAGNPGGGNITLLEAAKISGTSGNLGLRPSAAPSKINSRLYNAANEMVDGNVVVFDAAYSSDVDADDARKLGNPGGNFAIERSDKLLVIEGTRPPVNDDIIQFRTWNLEPQTYRLEFAAENMSTPGTTAVLEDSYLNTSTTLDLSNTANVSFVVDANPASAAANRFRIVFKQATPLPVNFISISANRIATGIKVDWKVGEERNIVRYEIERSADGRNFVHTGSVVAARSAAYSFTDASFNTAGVFYRIKSIGTTGEFKYSAVVKIGVGSFKPGFAVWPNPVEGGIINLQFKNQPAGNFAVTVRNAAGQSLLTSKLNHAGGYATQVVNLPSEWASGTYLLEVVAPDRTKTIQTIMVK